MTRAWLALSILGSAVLFLGWRTKGNMKINFSTVLLLFTTLFYPFFALQILSIRFNPLAMITPLQTEKYKPIATRPPPLLKTLATYLPIKGDISLKTPSDLEEGDLKEKVSIYSLAEVNLHDQPDSLWMIFYNKVYDVSNFTNSHPGGAEVLLECGGIDATEAFEEVGHSEDALNMLRPYYIGELTQADCLHYQKLKKPKSDAEVHHNKVSKKQKRRQEQKRKKLFKQLKVTVLFSTILLTLICYVYLQKFKLTYHP